MRQEDSRGPADGGSSDKHQRSWQDAGVAAVMRGEGGKMHEKAVLIFPFFSAPSSWLAGMRNITCLNAPHLRVWTRPGGSMAMLKRACTQLSAGKKQGLCMLSTPPLGVAVPKCAALKAWRFGQKQKHASHHPPQTKPSRALLLAGVFAGPFSSEDRGARLGPTK